MGGALSSTPPTPASSQLTDDELSRLRALLVAKGPPS
jgi:hypothetical protein